MVRCVSSGYRAGLFIGQMLLAAAAATWAEYRELSLFAGREKCQPVSGDA